MTKDEILKMNDDLYQLSDRARDPFSGRSTRRRDGLYFDHLGRRRYKETFKIIYLGTGKICRFFYSMIEIKIG